MAALQASTKLTEVHQLAKAAKTAAGALARLSGLERGRALSAIADELECGENAILAANKKDLEKAEESVKKGLLTESLASRLKLDSSKLASVIKGIRQLAALPDPIGKVEMARELAAGLHLYRITCPIGVIGVVFEARPDALPQIAALCLKAGNAVILKGGAEAEHSNRILFALLKRAATASGVPADALVLLESRGDFSQLLSADKYVDLIVPRGSGQLVKSIQDNTRIPVLGHAEGVCHVYVDAACDLNKAVRIAVDSKVQYPAACNASDTLLVHKDIAGEFLPRAAAELLKHGVELRCDSSSRAVLASDTAACDACESDWGTEYGDLIMAIKTVDSISEAIEHINSFGSAHTDAIVTEDKDAADRFFAEVNSAGVYVNCSTRFADGFRYGFGAEVGISTGKLHPRGPVGMEGLVTYKYRLVGQGHVVADYVGPNSEQFTHRDLDKETGEKGQTC